MSVLTFIDDIEDSKEGGPINISSWDIAVPLTLVKKPIALGSQLKITIENFRRRELMKLKFRPGGASPTCLKGQFESRPRRGTPPAERAYSTCLSTASKSDWTYSIGHWAEGTYIQKTNRVLHCGELEETRILDIPRWGVGISGGDIVMSLHAVWYSMTVLK